MSRRTSQRRTGHLPGPVPPKSTHSITTMPDRRANDPRFALLSKEDGEARYVIEQCNRHKTTSNLIKILRLTEASAPRDWLIKQLAICGLRKPGQGTSKSPHCRLIGCPKCEAK